MTRGSSLRARRPAAACLALFVAVEARAAVRPLSDGQAFSHVEVLSSKPAITPDGQYVVYCQDAVTEGLYELWSAPLDGGAPVQISRLLSVGSDCVFRISPDGSTVVYREFNVDSFLFGTAVDGSGHPATGQPWNLSLLPWMGGGNPTTAFAISADGATLVFIGDMEEDERFELFSVPIAGGFQRSKLNGPLVANGHVTSFAITPDGSTVVYRADQTTDGVFELYTAPIGGGGTWATLASMASMIVPWRDVFDFAISPDGAEVVYRADVFFDDRIELHSVPIDGGTTAVMNPGPVANGDVLSYSVSPDASRLVYLGDLEADGKVELYTILLEPGVAGSAFAKLNDDLVAGGDVETFAISPNSQRVVYVADQDVDGHYELYSVPIEGGTVVELDPGLPAFSYVDLDRPLISPDSARVVYRVFHGAGLGAVELYSVPIDGGATTRLSPLPPNGLWTAQRHVLADGGAHLFFELQTFPEPPETSTTTLLRAPIAGGSLDLAGPVLDLAALETFSWIAPGVHPRQVLFVANLGGGAGTELYAAGDVCVFCDGFESGNAALWSQVVP